MRNPCKKERVLDAAYQLFMKNGFDKTRIIDIANAADVGKGTVYEYFPSKEILFAEIFRARIMDAYEEIDAILSSAEPADLKLLAFLQFESGNLDRSGDTIQLLHDIVMTCGAQSKDAFHDTMYEMWKMRFGAVLAIVRDGMNSGIFIRADAEMTAVSVLGSLNFYLLKKHRIMPPSCMEIDADASAWTPEAYLDTILNGIRQKKG